MTVIRHTMGTVRAKAIQRHQDNVCNCYQEIPECKADTMRYPE